MAYTNLYSFAGQFAMSEKQKQGLVAKALARTEKKQEYFSLDISNEKRLFFSFAMRVAFNLKLELYILAFTLQYWGR